jgi:hypothetical protein
VGQTASQAAVYAKGLIYHAGPRGLHKIGIVVTNYESRLTLSQLMLHICRVSKALGDWYQKTHKTEDTNKVTVLAFKIIAILHNYTVGNVHKASGNCQQRPL